MTAPASVTVAAGRDGFNRAGIAALIGLGILFAAAFTLLSAFGTELNPGRNGGSHGLSVAATGYSGIVALAAATSQGGKVGRDEAALAGAGLLVLTPDVNSDGAEIKRLIDGRRGAPTLIVLPKHLTAPLPLKPHWAQRVAPLGGQAAAMPLRRLLPRLAIVEGAIPDGAALVGIDYPDLRLAAPGDARSLAPTSGLDPVLVGPQERIVIGWTAAKNLYVLADPDLIDNQGIAKLANAQAAVRLLVALADGRPGGIVFDVTLHGFGRSQSLLRTAFEPPFLALTLALLVTGALAAWAGAARFGTPPAPPRAIAFGKRALVDNAASLIRMGRREAAMAARYAGLMRDAAAARLRAPSGLTGAGLDDWLARRGGGGDYAALAAAATAATGRTDALAAARALFRWQETIA
ncbi:hypothetical protein IP88_14885 [alpha proteobacterium AAP81b]|nr:hypothetical protein IP88_14885 [alpha proteobacterium AAP81b]